MKKYMVPEMVIFTLCAEERLAACGDELYTWLQGGTPSQDILAEQGKYSGCEYIDFSIESLATS